jgi:hypothetical protein
MYTTDSQPIHPDEVEHANAVIDQNRNEDA